MSAICITEELRVRFGHVIYTCNLYQRRTLRYIQSCYLYLLYGSKRKFELHLVMSFIPAICFTEELRVTFGHVLYTCYMYQRGTLSYIHPFYLYLIPRSQRNIQLHLVMSFIPAIWITEEHLSYIQSCYLNLPSGSYRGTLSYIQSSYLYLIPG